MNFRAPGTRRRRVEATLELTPLIDVIFLLLIFFVMTTSPGMRAAERLDLDLPEARSGEGAGPSDDHRVTLRVYATGELFIQMRADLPEQEVTDLHAMLADLHAADPATPIWIRGDVEASHGAVIQVLDTARDVGFSAVHMAVRAPD